MPLSSLRSAAELLASADSAAGLAAIARSIGCDGDPAPLDIEARHRLGLDERVVDASVARGRGSLRALLLIVRDDAALRETLAKAASRLASRAPHALWVVIAAQPRRGDVAIAAWPGDGRPPRVAAMLANRSRLVDSDAETLRALVVATGDRDVLVHGRWVDILGRDSLTGRFYRDLERAVTGLAASASIGSDVERREAALLDASRLIFLAFLEAKGWLDGDGAFLVRQFERCAEAGGRFRQRVLRPLFFGTLNTPLHRRADTARAFGRVPFLNGGLFARAPIERSLRDLAFSDDAYGALLFDVFAQYRFTAREETATWTEAAVDPEMLGRAFESLMVSSERRRTGAFYTPYFLVERVSTSAMGVALGEIGARALAGESLDPRAREALLAMVGRITVLDPACGSGAFLVHALERLSALRAALGDPRDISTIRRDALTRSIFGVDINPTAVWLCELRLWLSVAIESEVSDPMTVTPLPNLDRNVRVGDALAGQAFGATDLSRLAASLRPLRERYAKSTGPRKVSLARQLERAERACAISAIDAERAVIAAKRRDLLAAQRGRDLFGNRRQASESEQRIIASLKTLSVSWRKVRRRIIEGGALPFSFGTQFADVEAAGGFDVVIGNPPWVRTHRVPEAQRLAYRRGFAVARAAAWEPGAAAAGAGRGFGAQTDVAALFVERSLKLLAPGGTMALLLPVKLWRSLAGGGVRSLLTSSARLDRVEDHSRAAAAFDAAVYPSLLVASRPRDDVPLQVQAVDVSALDGERGVEWRLDAACLPFDESRGAPWLLLPPEPRRGFDRLRELGRPLAESEIGRPRLGVKCGCNDAFLVELLEVDEDVAEILASDGRRTTIEREMLRPLVRGERLKRWTVAQSTDCIVWTHDAHGNARRGLPTRAMRWLSGWRKRLIARVDARHQSQWWTLFRVQAAMNDRARVVWGDLGREPRASVLLPGDPRVPLNTCYVARCRDVRDAYAFSALLNGPIARAWLDAIAEPARGNYKRYFGWTLSLLPIPNDWPRARDILAPVAEAAVRGDVPSEEELLAASLAAYGAERRTLAALMAWTAS